MPEAKALRFEGQLADISRCVGRQPQNSSCPEFSSSLTQTVGSPIQGLCHVLCFGGDGQWSGRHWHQIQTCAVSKFKVGDLSSFSVNGMLPLLLLFGQITMQAGQRAPKYAHRESRTQTSTKLTTGDIIGCTKDASPIVATPLLPFICTLTENNEIVQVLTNLSNCHSLPMTVVAKVCGGRSAASLTWVKHQIWCTYSTAWPWHTLTPRSKGQGHMALACRSIWLLGL